MEKMQFADAIASSLEETALNVLKACTEMKRASVREPVHVLKKEVKKTAMDMECVCSWAIKLSVNVMMALSVMDLTSVLDALILL